ncbi:hypothetical protein ACWGE0_21575 [Lentzea sp. NPDC054927]
MSFLAEMAGDYQRREAPLLRALDVLEASRAAWLVEVAAYADERAKQKRLKQCTPAPEWPPNSMSGHWYSTDPKVSRLAALHALKLWERDHEEAPAPDDVRSLVRSLVRSCIANGRLTDDQLDVVLSRAGDEEVRWPMTLMASANGIRTTRVR